MRLVSATVRNYRIHRSVTVDFDAARTVVGGPNESGKSTLAEAIHRALFFRAKSAAEPHKRMRSDYGGIPEVDLVFEAGGVRYELRKRFSGASGTVVLTPAGGSPLSGDEAEETLAGLLGVPAAATPKASTGQWAHLWVEQGQGTDDPAQHSEAQRDRLIARLQDIGGAAAMQSDLDTRVAARFAERSRELFNQNGSPKAASDLARAQHDLAGVNDAREEANARLTRLRESAEACATATVTIAAAKRDLEALDLEQRALNERQFAVNDLQRRLEAEERTAGEANERVSTLEKGHRELSELQKRFDLLRANLAPLKKEQEELVRTRDVRRDEVKAAEKSGETGAARLRSARLATELANAAANMLEKQEQLAGLAGRLGQVRSIEESLSPLRARLAKVPAIDAPAMKSLQKAEATHAEVRASLAAMATAIELVGGKVAVTIDGTPLAPGEKRIVTDDAELNAGDALRLRIRPGGGASLDDARRAVLTAEKKIQTMLDSLGVASIPAAIEAATNRQTIASEIKTLEARLADFKPAELAHAHAAMRDICAAAGAEIERRQSEVAGYSMPADLASGRVAASRARDELEQAELEEKTQSVRRDSALRNYSEVVDLLEKHRRDLEERRTELTRVEAELRVLLKNHGDEGSRAEALAAARLASESTTSVVRGTKQALEARQPALLPAALERVSRAIEEKKRLRDEAGTREAVERHNLNSDGSTDPAAALARAQARLDAAKAQVARAEAHANAIKLLDELFSLEQRALAEQFSRPLAEKISGYLETLFGHGTRAALSLEDNRFSGLQLSRPALGAASHAFDFLSGGTREQFAAAVRLAMAEILAADHDGCLPVVFDDSFAFTDRARLKNLQDMLDLGARRGLQIIILTCAPSDYAGLGAREVALAPAQSHPTNIPPDGSAATAP